MHPTTTLEPRPDPAKGRTTALPVMHCATRGFVLETFWPMLLPMLLALGSAVILMRPTTAQAADGCKVLLCLSAPSWRQIPQCVPTIEQLHRDLARGRPFPVCEMAGAGNGSGLEWADPPANCPPQYTRRTEMEAEVRWSCDFVGAVWTMIDGQPFTRTWWNEGDSVTEYSPAAKQQLGSWDPRFDNDYAAWVALQPPPTEPPCSGCEPRAGQRWTP